MMTANKILAALCPPLKRAARKKTGGVTVSKTLIPRETFVDLPWWKRLTPDDQQKVQQEGQALGRALVEEGFSRLAVGEHLSNLHELLEPQRLFVRFLKNFHFSQRTAYRYINGFRNARERLPEYTLRRAIARGMNMIGDTEERPLGVYTDAVKRLPPPAEPDPAAVDEWLDKVEERKRRQRSQQLQEGAGERAGVDTDPQAMMKEVFRNFRVRLRRLPAGRTRGSWVKTLAGMMLAEAGIGNEQSIAPVAPPEDFRATRGRPRKKSAEAVSA
jgi:hypothetical protein